MSLTSKQGKNRKRNLGMRSKKKKEREDEQRMWNELMLLMTGGGSF